MLGHPPHRTGRDQLDHPVLRLPGPSLHPGTSLCYPGTSLLRNLPNLVDRLYGVWHLVWFHSTKRDVRLHLPFSGSFGSHFPTFSVFRLLDLRYYDPLRLLLFHPGSLRSSLVHRYLASPLSFVCRKQEEDTCLPGLFLYRSPFRLLHLTRSWQSSRVPRLPLCAHAPFLVSGGVLLFAITHTGLTPSSHVKLSAFPDTAAGYPCSPYGPQRYCFRRSIARPTHSLHPASHPTSRPS